MTVFKKLFKSLENLLLRMDSFFCGGFCGSNSRARRNLSENSRVAVDGLVIDQHARPVGEMRYGRRTLHGHGCGVIACYNGAVLLGVAAEMAQVIYEAECSGVMTGGTLLGGRLGSNPYSLKRLIRRLGLSCRSVGIDEMTADGVYVVTSWNSLEYGSMLHSYAAVCDGGTYSLYNYIPGRVVRMGELGDIKNGFVKAYHVYVTP